MRRLMRWLPVLLVVVLALLPVSAVSAIANPDTPPSVKAVYVYQNVLETGDVGVLIDYYIDYAPLPTETATDAYLSVFVDTDGVTQLKSVAPYSFSNKGYRRGLVWIYFSPSEVTAYSLSSVNVALYRIWLIGNPTIASGWPGDPPKTVATIDEWNTTGSPAVLLALRVLYYANILEGAWSMDLIEATSLGSKLTTLGMNYFESAMLNLREMAPAAFPSTTVTPELSGIDYSTSFGATMTDGPAPGGGTVTGSPVTLVSGSNTVDVTANGTFTLVYAQGTKGTVTNGTGTVTGSPVTIVAGTNTITTTVIGTLIVVATLQDTTASLEGSIVGTGWDLTGVAAAFGFSRWMFSTVVWLIISVIICAGVYKWGSDRDLYSGGGAAKVVLPTLILCIVGGTLLGFVKLVVAALMFIVVVGLFVGYVLFFRGATA